METGMVVIDAEAAFARERRRRRGAAALRWLLRRECNSLPTLEQALGSVPQANRRLVGQEAIPLESIVGTAEGAKARSFDRRFRPPASSRHRWERLWVAARRGEPVAPISVFRVGDRHFVRDGHHRVSVAQALGAAAIDAEVTELSR